MNKYFVIICFFFSFSLFALSTELTFFVFHDQFECDSSERKDYLPKMMSLLEEERENAKHHFTLINGDFVSSPFFSHWDKGEHIIELLNEMKINYVCLGAHDLEYGVKNLKNQMKKSSFQWLAANLLDQNDKPFTGKNQMHLLNVDGVRIGMFGLVDEKITALCSTSDEIIVLPFEYIAKKMVENLKKASVDVIILLTNLSWKKDQWLAQNIPEIDVIIGLHEESPFCFFEKDTFVHQCGYRSDFLTRIDLTIHKSETPFKSEIQVLPTWKIASSKNRLPHPGISEKIQKIQQKHTSQILSEED